MPATSSGFHSTGKAFEVLIQLGAILAILTVYARRLLSLAAALPTDPAARRFVAGILLAFLPAAVAGALLHDFIKTVLFETPVLIAVMLMLGGIVLLWVDRRPERPLWHNAMDFPLPMAFQDRPLPVPCTDPGRLALRSDDRRRTASRRGQALGGRVLLLSVDARPWPAPSLSISTRTATC